MIQQAIRNMPEKSKNTEKFQQRNRRQNQAKILQLKTIILNKTQWIGSTMIDWRRQRKQSVNNRNCSI